ncbi:nickel pincer cofactor biosynthesis protein LarB [Clostridium aminobutyricum]|uniref:Nickel pincer cofactor biosynthesis protein LarB n=1 Tax=Clostridium aminobutyricum TaxID=33953 RepID=A0A939D5T5_CLOAM|nr:nickel pincer cofactor biosynthesis protein LarB [Clostridium aminobutyricum]MBN7771909.1 nickel pincer cofactor biosynthesis protein LarB [Clostridium aminobutyricum]
MDNKYLEQLLNKVANGETAPAEAVELLKKLPFEDLEFVNIDNHRGIRTGFPEAVFCQGKMVQQVAVIIQKLSENNDNIIGSRATKEQYEATKALVPDAIYDEVARTIIINRNPIPSSDKIIAIVTAGTADIPVAEEAAVTAMVLGNKVDRIYDVGVAGIHRLFAKLDRIRSANVVIVVAGMEGALASVVGGLVDKPVIAVPTSIGYGANLGGLSALLSMLNSCANGVGIVNIDNGFGAAYLASKINRMD